MRITAFGRTLSLGEGPTENVRSRAKAWNTSAPLDLTQDPTRTFTRLRGFRHIYLQGGYVAEGIDLFPIFAFGAGYDVEIDKDIAEKLGVSGEAEQQTVKEFLQRINFYDVQWQLSVDAAVVRDGVAEIVFGSGKASGVPVNVVPRPAECFEFRTNLQGVIQSYDQIYDNRGNSITPIKFEPSSILHYQFLSRPDSPYGISLIERTVHDINRDTKVTEAITSGICLHGTPKFCTVVNGTKENAPKMSDTEWKEFEDSQKDFNARDNFLYEGDVKMQVIDTSGVQGVSQYSDVTLFRVCAGMGTPAELLGLRQGTTDATAVSRIGSFLKKIRIVQRDIESLWNLNIIDKITGKPGLIKIQLKDVDPDDFGKMATAIAALRTGMNPDAVAPAEWARERLGIPLDESLNAETPEQPAQPPMDQTQLAEWLQKQAQPAAPQENQKPGI